MAFSLTRLGLAKAKINQLNAKGIFSVEDLACFFPRKYYDFRYVRPIKEAVDGAFSMVHGKVDDVRAGVPGRAYIIDKDGDRMVIESFSGYALGKLEIGKWYYFGGKLTHHPYLGAWCMNSPQVMSPYPSACKITPVYSKIKGMSDYFLVNSIDSAISFLKVNYVLGEKDLLARRMGLMEHMDAIKALHHPKIPEDTGKAQKRLAFDKIYDFYIELSKRKRYAAVTKRAGSFKRVKTDAFIASQPFNLTVDQSNVIETIITETMAGNRLNAIVSGDVGCGKTMVAMAASAFMAENGYQAVLMAPTLVLARQHYSDFQALATAQGFRVELLTGETKKKARLKILEDLKNGEIDILVGTHAVLSKDLEFKKLGLTVVDEEHKFGVAQKQMIESFSKAGAHHLSMTATPIPRSMAMGIYGDTIKVLPIHSMPTGRKPIVTKILKNLKEAAMAIQTELDKGHQAYVLCPYIDDSESNPDIWSTEHAFSELKKMLQYASIGRISGDMKTGEITEMLDLFASGQLDILVSTTIVEVGVNVPNATAMVILSADRFGLSALHQIRGRVGRGIDQGYCYLLPDVQTDKLDILCKTSDGFEVSEEDMRRRGPGNLLGLEQKGANEEVELILRWPNMAAKIRKAIAA